ncbi:MAG: hypothetical protein ACRELG_29265 [Gemmataceae bacterium]
MYAELIATLIAPLRGHMRHCLASKEKFHVQFFVSPRTHAHQGIVRPQKDRASATAEGEDSAQTFTLSLSNWTTDPGQYSDEIRADELSQYNSSGTNTGTTVYDSGYALPLITNLTIKSITLPDDSDIDILGMLLA